MVILYGQSKSSLRPLFICTIIAIVHSFISTPHHIMIIITITDNQIHTPCEAKALTADDNDATTGIKLPRVCDGG